MTLGNERIAEKALAQNLCQAHNKRRGPPKSSVPKSVSGGKNVSIKLKRMTLAQCQRNRNLLGGNQLGEG